MFFEGNQVEYMEAGVVAIAVVLMFYMSGWMSLRQDPRTWIKELRGDSERALNSGTAVSLGAIAFLAVLRGGGETVLFLHVLAASSEGWSIGLIAALGRAPLGLAVIYHPMQRLARIRA